jgi:hypothetical protein
MRASVDHTNVASLRHNLLPSNKLRLAIVGVSDNHTDMSETPFGSEASHLRFHEFLLNCANLEKKR